MRYGSNGEAPCANVFIEEFDASHFSSAEMFSRPLFVVLLCIHTPDLQKSVINISSLSKPKIFAQH